jgi:hypothetical protein
MESSSRIEKNDDLKGLTVTTSPTSYLQTLADDETTAFVVSLQSVKAHLSQELQWINEKLQQKSIQLQGIETLLSEALALGLIATGVNPTSKHTSTKESTAVLPSTESVTTDATTDENDLEIPAAIVGEAFKSGQSIDSIGSIAAAIAALPDKTSSKQRGGQAKSDYTKTTTGSKSSANAKKLPTKAQQSKQSTSKASRTGKTSGLNQFLQSQFRDKALTESVSDILNRAPAPLSTDDVMAKLYNGLSEEDYQRAKHSLANILSLGKSKGAWKSAGRGRYTGNAAMITA